MLGQIKNTVKLSIAFIACLAARLFHLPVPNLEPVMATVLPVSNKLGKYAGFAFAFFAIALIDAITGKVGLWTVYTAIAYGAVAYFASAFFAKIKGKVSWKHYAGIAAIGTIAYDAITAAIFGWQFGQPLAVTAMGQIPFTLYHLLGNVALAATLSPLLQKHLLESKAIDSAIDSLFSKIARVFASI